MAEEKFAIRDLAELNKLVDEMNHDIELVIENNNAVEDINSLREKLTLSRQLLANLTMISEEKGVVCWREHCARQELQAIQRASAAILSNLELDQVLEQIAVNVTEGIGFDRAVLFLVDREKKNIQGKYCSGIPKNKIEKMVVSLKERDGLLYQVIWEGKSFNVANAADDNILSSSYKEIPSHTNSLALVPVTSSTAGNNCWQKRGWSERGACLVEKNKEGILNSCLECAEFDVFGVLAVDNCTSKRPISEENIESLQLFAQNAAIAIKNALLHGTVQKMAVTDSLTGLYNHGFLHDFLAREIAGAMRWGESIALIMLDLDNFKKFNDTHGHPQGDKVLQKVADILKYNTRKVDLAARYGGEEFTLVLTQTDGPGAHKVAERVRKEVAETIFSGCGGEEVFMTISAGIAVFEPGMTEAQLVQMADEALYQAKKQGRNRVIAYQRGGVHSEKQST